MDTLKGIKILDFSRLLPGPLATKYLLKMGAEVIKIEQIDRPELIQLIPPYIDGISASYRMLNNGKEICQIDFNSEEGKRKILDLVKNADVVVESFRPGTMNKLGFSYKDLSAINPGIIYVSATSYGQEGPYSHLAGHDLNFMALSGILSLNTDGENVTIPSFQLADLFGGTQQIINAVLLGVIEKLKHKKGGWYDISITESVMPMASLVAISKWQNQDNIANEILSGKLPNYTIYRCKDNKFVVFAGLEQKFWTKFCTKINKEEWSSFNLLELTSKTEIKQELNQMFLSKNRDEWLEFFKDVDICFTTLYDLNETLIDPHFVEKNIFEKSSNSDFPLGWELGIIRRD